MYERTYGSAKSGQELEEVDFADAATVLHDELAVTVPDDDPNEDQFITMGADALGRILVVVFTEGTESD